MAPKLYKLDISPPARATMMTCSLFKIPVEYIDVDLVNKANLKPDYLKKNPLHTVPVLEDGDITLHDSHAIIMYLSDTYAKNDGLYPKDVKRRALVNQILFFDAAVFFARLRDITYGAFIQGVKEVTQKQLDSIDDAYGYVEQFLTRTKYIAGDQLTIADISVVATLSSTNEILPVTPEKYPKTAAWFQIMQKYDFYQYQNARGVADFGKILRQLVNL